MVKESKGGSVTEIITQGGSLTTEQREQAQELLAELVLLSAASAALKRAPLSKTERARRLAPIVARREVVEATLFPER